MARLYYCFDYDRMREWIVRAVNAADAKRLLGKEGIETRDIKCVAGLPGWIDVVELVPSGCEITGLKCKAGD